MRRDTHTATHTHGHTATQPHKDTHTATHTKTRTSCHLAVHVTNAPLERLARDQNVAGAEIGDVKRRPPAEMLVHDLGLLVQRPRTVVIQHLVQLVEQLGLRGDLALLLPRCNLAPRKVEPTESTADLPREGESARAKNEVVRWTTALRGPRRGVGDLGVGGVVDHLSRDLVTFTAASHGKLTPSTNTSRHCTLTMTSPIFRSLSNEPVMPVLMHTAGANRSTRQVVATAMGSSPMSPRQATSMRMNSDLWTTSVAEREPPDFVRTSHSALGGWGMHSIVVRPCGAPSTPH